MANDALPAGRPSGVSDPLDDLLGVALSDPRPMRQRRVAAREMLANIGAMIRRIGRRNHKADVCAACGEPLPGAKAGSVCIEHTAW